jgi:hypothetical protein
MPPIFFNSASAFSHICRSTEAPCGGLVGKNFRAASAALCTWAPSAADDAYSDKAPDRPAQPETVFTAEEQRAIDALAAGTIRKRGAPPSPAWVAYEQAVQNHEREVERLKGECGVTAAHEMEGAALDATGRAAQVLVETPAKTLAGLIFKARYAATHYSDDYDSDVMVSIVDDLLAMADDPEGLEEA